MHHDHNRVHRREQQEIIERELRAFGVRDTSPVADDVSLPPCVGLAGYDPVAIHTRAHHSTEYAWWRGWR